MSENQIGEAIKDAFLFLKPIFSDTARLLTIVEERMNRNKLIALWGSTAMWDRSYAFYGDHGWIAHYLNRFFVSSTQKNEKPSFQEKKGAYVNVYFEPKKLSQPIIVYGTIQCEERNLWSVLQSLLTVNTGPEFVTSENVNEWTKIEDAGNYILFYKVLPLTDVTNKDAVESICDETVNLFNQL